MRTNKATLLRGIKFLAITIVAIFSASFVLSQAFKNEDHPFFWPVLVVGLILTITAIALGFYGIKVLTDAFFGKKRSS